MINNKFADKIFYHIYALGLSGSAKNNDFSCPAGNFFERLEEDLDRIKGLGCNAILIGPVCESSAHGYDTVDYYHIERRLGNNESFKHFSKVCHEKGFSLCLDAVFNHTGRDFFAFKDIQKNGQNSRYKDWYMNLNFSRKSDRGDCFDYDGWAGCKDLVKLNVENREVQQHLFGAVKFWAEEFGIDGLRLDAADVLSKNFLDKLGAFCREINPDFWLMGEVVHGDYREWAKDGRIDSVTNYQIYNALWESLNEQNFFNLSWNLNREFNQAEGLYNFSNLYTFLDNHDVKRIGSALKKPLKHLHLVYSLAFTIPGIPSVYYGSEYGIKGDRTGNSDYQLRPSLPPFSDFPDYAKPDFDGAFVYNHIAALSKIRKESLALQQGTYRQELVTNSQFAFWRELDLDHKNRNTEYEAQNVTTAEKNPDFYKPVLVAANAAFESAVIQLNVPDGNYTDLLTGKIYNSNELKNARIEATTIWILRRI